MTPKKLSGLEKSQRNLKREQELSISGKVLLNFKGNWICFGWYKQIRR